MNRRTKNQRNAFTIMLISGLFLFSFVAIMVMFTAGGGGTIPLDPNQIAAQQTQAALALTLTAMSNGGGVNPPPPPPSFPTNTPFFPPTPQIVTLTPAPLPGGPINFFDNFDNGFSPYWQVTGEWMFTNGQPVFTGRPRCDGRLLTGAVNWDNYALEFDRTNEGVHLVFGYKDEQNYFDIGGFNGTIIEEYYNGNRSYVNTSDRGYVPRGKTHLEIHGNKIKFYTINSYGDINLIYDMQLARPMNGLVGFKTCNTGGAVLDNFRVYSIP